MADVVVTKEVGEHVPEYRWIATLSNGEKIYEDKIPVIENAWIRLAKYIKNNNLCIKGLELFMKGLKTRIPSNKVGYFHLKKARSLAGLPAIVMHGIGHLDGDNVHIIWCGTNRSSFKETRENPGEPCVILNKG